MPTFRALKGGRVAIIGAEVNLDLKSAGAVPTALDWPEKADWLEEAEPEYTLDGWSETAEPEC